jgi:hypothetical protein
LSTKALSDAVGLPGKTTRIDLPSVQEHFPCEVPARSEGNETTSII